MQITETQRNYFKKQVLKFAALGNMPSTTEGLGCLVDALIDASGANEQLAAEIATELIRDWSPQPNHAMPLPADILAAGRLRRKEPLPNVNCVHCGGLGWEIIERGGVTGTARCRAGCVPGIPRPEDRWNPRSHELPDILPDRKAMAGGSE
jgi:hypothetical protein